MVFTNIKPKYSVKNLAIVILLLTILGLPGCKKEPDIPVIGNKIILDSTQIDSVSYRMAAVSSRIKNLSGHFIKYGHCWNQSGSPEYKDNQTGFDDLPSNEPFSSTLTGLIPDKSYFVRPYVITPKDTIYGVVIPIRTLKLAIPSLTTTPVTNISLISADGGGTVSSDGGSEIIVRGTCWSQNQNPTLEGNDGFTSDSTGLGAYKSIIAGLSPNTPYYIRAYATNVVGTAYGNQVNFRTSPILPTVTTTSISEITQTSASGGGIVEDDGGTIVTSRGVCWSKMENPSLSDNKTNDGVGTGEFKSKIDGLEGNTTYYVRAFAISSVGTAYGMQESFLSGPDLPSVTTSSISDISQTSASGGGDVHKDGGVPVVTRGVCWGLEPNPSISGNKTSNGSGIGSFASRLTGLTGNTTYYVRAYATNATGTGYGNQEIFNTSAVLPTVTTSLISNISENSADGGGEISNDGGSAILSRGVCWSTAESPTIANSRTNDGTGTGLYISALTGLSGNTTYFVRAYATNGLGTSYGDQVSFKTSPYLPTLTTSTISEITTTTAKGGGTIISDGGGSIIQRGVCWSKDQNPTISDSKSNDGTGTGEYISSINGLSASTTYYVRAFATNSSGTSYGGQEKFATNPLGSPVVSTASISDISTNSAKGGGIVISDGGSQVTVRGICWSVNQLPTVLNRKTEQGSGIGEFTSQMTGLDQNMTYFVRAYATNNTGTSYGSQEEFKTSTIPLKVITSEITRITTNSATTGGEVISDGGSAILARGVCWSKNQNPTVTDQSTSNGTGIGSFTSVLSGLETNTIYYTRAYATNIANTMYGDELMFATEAVPGEFTDSRDNTTYKTVWIGNQKWMAQNLAYLPSVNLASSNSTSVKYYYVYEYDGTSLTTAKALTNFKIYGVLYNWPAALIACPSGWHLPSDVEWTALHDFLGVDAGFKIKASSGWLDNGNGNNTSGFTALPGGFRNPTGVFGGLGINAYFWTATADGTNALYRYMYAATLGISKKSALRSIGFSVRCVRD